MTNPQTVTVHRAPLSVNRYGQTVPDPTATTDHTIDGCRLAPSITGEIVDGTRTGHPEEWTLYGPAGADIKPDDEITTTTGKFKVDGHPADWSSGWGTSLAGTVAVLKRIDG